MRKGDAVLIEPHEVHQIWNEGDIDVNDIAIGIAGGADGQTVLM